MDFTQDELIELHRAIMSRMNELNAARRVVYGLAGEAIENDLEVYKKLNDKVCGYMED